MLKMKKLNIFGGGYPEYLAPAVTTLEVVVEKGFATSNDDDDESNFGGLPGLEDGGDI